MPLDVPNLDDRRWADLVDEARALIPLIAPQWTDHNVHDPGITFIELFAWLAEMQIYQLNRVGEAQRELFGRMAGVERKRRTPARVAIRIEGAVGASTFLRAGTPLEPLDGGGSVFETDVALWVTRSRLVAVIVSDAAGPIDQTRANERPSATFLAFGEEAAAGATLRLGFDAFHPDDEPTLRLSFDVVTDDLGAPCRAEEPPVMLDPSDATDVVPADLAWECLAAENRWLPVTVQGDTSSSLAHSGIVTLTTPADAAIERGAVWIRARIARGAYDIEPRLRQVSVNVLSCSQRETVGDEIHAPGTGRPNQSLTLAKTPLLVSDATLTLRVGADVWQAVDSIEGSGPGDTHYVLDAATGEIAFGNGLNGRVPGVGQEIVAVRYQTSNGSAGNVGEGLQWRFKNGDVPGAAVVNTAAASGGAEPETLDDLELRARARLLATERAVTLRDIEAIAEATPGAFVARATAIANCPHRESITVVAVPKVRPGRTGLPKTPSPAFLDAVRRFLQRRRLLCDDIRVAPPRYVRVRVTARLRVVKGAGASAVLERARAALDAFLTGGVTAADPCPTLWPFGRSVFPSEVYAVLDEVAGVDFVSSLVLSGTADGEVVAADAVTGALPIGRTGLVVPDVHDLAVDAGGRSAR